MHRILSVNNKKEVVVSIPKGQIDQEKEVIFRMASAIGAEITTDDIFRAQEFSEKYNLKELILIINQEGLSFLPDIYYDK